MLGSSLGGFYATVMAEASGWPAVLALRLAVLLCRSRRPVDLPPTLHLSNNGQSFSLMVSAEWLNHNPLTAGALKQEEDPWRSTGLTLSVQQQA